MNICGYLRSPRSLPSPRSLGNVLRRAAVRILDFLIPESCLGCRTAGVTLCEACVRGIPPPTHGASRDIISLFDYRNELIRKALWTLKYRGGARIGTVLGELVYAKIAGVIGNEGGMEGFGRAVLIPIPLSKKRARERGFNQSEILAEALSHKDQGKHFAVEPSVLYRIRDTGSQARIKDRKTRINNVKGCFAIKNKEKIAGRDVILIDDVTTTGATLEEAKKVLVDNGAKSVIAVTVAH